MQNRHDYVIKKIKQHHLIKSFLKLICISFLVLGICIFGFYGLRTNEQIMKFIASQKQEKFEKIMTNPRIKFEYNDNEFYDIKATKAVYKNDESVLLSDVFAKGDSGNIKAGELLIQNGGDDLYFSNNPVLIIEQDAPKN